QFVISLAGSGETKPGPDIHNAVDDRRTAGDTSRCVKLPKYLAGLRVVSPYEITGRSRKQKSVLARAGNRNRTVIRIAVGAQGLPQDFSGSGVERANRALLVLAICVRDREVEAFSVRGVSKDDRACETILRHIGLPRERAVSCI